jgi:hypothetical protein
LEQIEIGVITNENRQNWPEWTDYYKSQKKYLSIIAQANRASGFTRKFGEIKEEKTEVRLYCQPDYWEQKVLAQNGIEPSDVDCGYNCKACEAYAIDYASIMEHCRSKSHMDTLRGSASGTWKVPAVDTSKVLDTNYLQPHSQGPFVSSASVSTDEPSGLVLSVEPKGIAAVAFFGVANQSSAIKSVVHRQASGYSE